MFHTKHGTKIVNSPESYSILLKILQNYPRFSFFLAEILLNACNFGGF